MIQGPNGPEPFDPLHWRPLSSLAGCEHVTDKSRHLSYSQWNALCRHYPNKDRFRLSETAATLYEVQDRCDKHRLVLMKIATRLGVQFPSHAFLWDWLYDEIDKRLP